MCSSRNRSTYGITTSSFSPPTNEAIPLRLALLNPWLAPWIGYRTADGYFSTACSEYLMSTIKSLVPCGRLEIILSEFFNFVDYSGINVPLVAVCNVPPVAQCNVPPQKWLQ